MPFQHLSQMLKTVTNKISKQEDILSNWDGHLKPELQVQVI